jgi:hypothetical protein
VGDPLPTTFQRRLAAQGRAAYGYQLRSMLLNAERLCGRMLTCADPMRDVQLQGRVLVDDTAPSVGAKLSRWTLAQRSQGQVDRR